MVTLSKSSLNTFLTCPHLYKFLYVDRISIDFTSPAAQRGTDVHQFCYDFYDHVGYLYGKESKLEIEGIWLDRTLNNATDEARPYMENFVKFEKERWNICVESMPNNPWKYFMPVLREKKISNLGLKIRGIIDRVDLNFDDKTYTVVDYKTEAYSEKSWKRTEKRREMAFYKTLVETSGLITGEVTHFCIMYPRSNDVWVERFSNRTLNALERCEVKVRSRIEAEDFPCKVGIYCRWCDCSSICPME